MTRWHCCLLFGMALTWSLGTLSAQPQAGKPSPLPITILEMEGIVEVSRAGAVTWDPCYTNQVLHVGDRLRTRARSRVTLHWSDASTKRIDELSEIQIQAPPDANGAPGFNLIKGVLYFFHRGKPADVRIKTRTASAAVRGTEFNLEVLDDGRTILTMFDGEVELSNEAGAVVLQNGEQGVAVPGQPPTKTALLEAELINTIQWCLYYPAVLDLNELSLAAAERQALSASLEAYRSGDLLQALAKYPEGRQPVSAAEKVFFGAILLSVGRVDQTDALLDPVASDPRERLPAALARSLRQVIAAVKGRTTAPANAPFLATGWLAESYSRQASADLEGALAAARMAVQADPNFGFGWARVAELEFSFGHISDAVEALDTSLRLSPRNAEALALKGFLLGAQNKIRQALEYFDRAIAVDGALGNAWLGRGLCRIRQGKTEAGRLDLQTAVIMEPQRALLRSYLGKAYGDSGDRRRATNELALAKRIDPMDPTAWLYSALLNQQDNRINEAVRDLERSQELNDNRALYRSRLLLDQDRAVRSANLANIYRDAGMTDWSVREASRAVAADYANYSAHLFLANSYDLLRDPKRVNLRYETPAESEYLIANLLAPVGAGTLSQSISQQEYSKLFERDQFGIVSSTEYFSNGDWVQGGAQFGVVGNFGYSLEAFYRSDNGQRPNNEFEERNLTLKAKQEFAAGRVAYLQTTYYEASGGDAAQYYDPNRANPALRTRENQDPIVTLGYHHEWNPGSHTLLLGSRLSDRFSVQNLFQPSLFARRSNDHLRLVEPMTIHQRYRGTLEIYAAELQQILQRPRFSTILGARIQAGEFRTRNLQGQPVLSDFDLFFDPDNPTANQDLETDFSRVSAYAYQHWTLFEPLLLVGGLAYDRLIFPENFRAAPINDRREEVRRLSPKAGLVWTPDPQTTVRAAYTRSLSGASIDQSLQLEPSQVAGFNQSFRSIIPESVGGANAGARHETTGLSLEHRFPTATYVALSGEAFGAKVNRTLGIFEAPPPNTTDFVTPSSTREEVNYRERSLQLTLNQMVGEEWSFGARYRLADADLHDEFREVQPRAIVFDGFRRRQHLEATLQEITLRAIYDHPSGFFGRVEALWFAQDNRGFARERPGDDFWQFNVFAGYRFSQRRVEAQAGVLNVSGRDYRLEPLNYHSELPRERTLVVRLRFNF